MICREIFICENILVVFLLMFLFLKKYYGHVIFLPLKISISSLTNPPSLILLSVSEDFKETCIFCLALHINGVFNFSIFILIFCLLDVTFDLRGMC